MWTEPACCRRREREPKEEMRVRPQGRAADAVHDLHQVVMVVPVDRDEHEAEEIDGELRNERPQVVQAASVWWTKAEDHDRDDHGDHAVAERFEATGAHRRLTLPGAGWSRRRTAGHAT